MHTQTLNYFLQNVHCVVGVNPCISMDPITVIIIGDVNDTMHIVQHSLQLMNVHPVCTCTKRLQACYAHCNILCDGMATVTVDSVLLFCSASSHTT